MKALKTYLEGKNLYVLFLHVAVLALAVEVVVLARQNSELKNPKDRGGKEQLAVGDSLSINDLKPLKANYTLPVNSPNQLLFVFTTTCPFCKKNLDNWKKLSEIAKEKNIAVVGIALDLPDSTAKYMSANKIDFNVLFPADVNAYRQKYKLLGVPKTILRDSSGVVRGVWTGLLNGQQVEEVASAISDFNNSQHITGGSL